MTIPLETIVDRIRQHPKLVVAEDFEVAIQRSASKTRRYQNGRLTLHSSDEKIWISLRVLHRRQPGRSVTSFHHKEALNALVESAFESSHRASPDPWFRFPLWKKVKESPTSQNSICNYDPLFFSLTEAPDLLDETYEQAEIDTLLSRKTERFPLGYSKPFHALQFAISDRRAEQPLWMKEERAFSRPLTERADWLDGLLHQYWEFGRSKTGGCRGSSPWVASSNIVASLLKRVISWFYADLVQTGRSPLPLAKADNLFSPAVTLVDNGDFPGAVHSAPFDMEGALSQETVLVNKGELNEFLYDTYSATRENRISTGNFIRPSFALTPRISASNLYLAPSTLELDALLRQMGSGYFLTHLDGLDTQPGNESELYLHASGWRVEQGECAEPVRGLCTLLNLQQLLRRIVQVAADLNFYGSFGAPSVLFETAFFE